MINYGCYYPLDHVLFWVVIDDGGCDVMERLEPLFDGFLVVVHAPARLRATQQTFGHRVVWDIEIQDTFRGGYL